MPARLIAPPLLLLSLTSCRFGMFPGSSDQGRDISNLYQVLFMTAIPVGGVVYALILWSIIRYRKRRGDDQLPKQVRYHIPLEVTYTVIPVLVVLGLFAATFRTEQRVDHVSAHPAVVVRVTGFQWQWRFQYPAYGISIVGVPSDDLDEGPTMVLPVGQTVEIDLQSEDVIHAFFVPGFNFKRDVIPGVTNRFDLTIPLAGTFRGECAEFCGLDHAEMTFFVKAVPPAEFQRWVQQQATGGAPA